MVESQCDARTVKAYIMSDLLKRIDFDTTSDFVKLFVAVVGFYAGLFYLEYVDTEYSLWLTWFLTPVIVTFLLPGLIIVLIYVSSIIFHCIRLYRMRIVEAGVPDDWRHAARLAVCALWDAHGWLWHGYEIRGIENIPDGPFLAIYYHGALPIDMYYFTARMLLFKRRQLHTVGDRFMFKIPGWCQLLENLCVIPGTVQTCAGVLRAGNPLAISPGGVYEAQFGDHYYKLNWKNRIGFAKVAQEAKVPIVPMFTQNVREAFRTVGWLRGLCLRVYAATRIPLAPVYGGFPVKLITHLGKPIPHDPSLTPEQLQKKVASAIEDLIEEHQRVPGSILLALIERVYELPKKKKGDEKTELQKKEGKPLTNGSCLNGKLKHHVESQNDIKSDVNVTKSNVNDTKSNVNDAKSDVVDAKSDVVEAKSDVVDAKSDVVDAKSDVNDTKSDVKDTKFDANYIKSDVDSTKSDVDDTKSDVKDTKFDINHTKTNVDDIKFGVNYTKSNVDDLKFGVNYMKPNVDDIKFCVNHTKSDVNDTKSDENDKKSDIKHVKSNNHLEYKNDSAKSEKLKVS